jgi:hypothetical protein
MFLPLSLLEWIPFTLELLYLFFLVESLREVRKVGSRGHLEKVTSRPFEVLFLIMLAEQLVHLFLVIFEIERFFLLKDAVTRWQSVCVGSFSALVVTISLIDKALPISPTSLAALLCFSGTLGYFIPFYYLGETFGLLENFVAAYLSLGLIEELCKLGRTSTRTWLSVLAFFWTSYTIKGAVLVFLGVVSFWYPQEILQLANSDDNKQLKSVLRVLASLAAWYLTVKMFKIVLSSWMV